MSVQYDYCFQVILVGDTGVGKTSALNRLTQDFFTSSFIPTIGIEFKVQIFNIDDKRIRMQIWDIAEQDRFRAMANNYLTKSDGIMLFYDMTDRRSFSHVSTWIAEIDENCDKLTHVKMVIANKSEHSTRRKVSIEEGKLLAEKHGAAYFETSALNGENVSEAFVEMARLLRRQADATNKQISPRILSPDCMMLESSQLQQHQQQQQQTEQNALDPTTSEQAGTEKLHHRHHHSHHHHSFTSSFCKTS